MAAEGQRENAPRPRKTSDEPHQERTQIKTEWEPREGELENRHSGQHARHREQKTEWANEARQEAEERQR